MIKKTESSSAFERLYEESIKPVKEGDIIKGRIIAITQKEAVIDVGYKSEGFIPLAQFAKDELEVGKEIEVLVEAVEDDSGKVVLSKEKAYKAQGWDKITQKYKEGDLIDGRPVKKVKGGFLVDVMGTEAFLPASLSMFKGVPDKDIIGQLFKFKLIKVDNLRKGLIVSRREALQREREDARNKLWGELKVGEIRQGLVKAITDFGAFIDLGGLDGLLHITDMSWSKIAHPSEMLTVGDKIDVAILNVDSQTHRVSLGLKQRLPDPWSDVESKFSVGSKIKGKVVNILPYGVFVEIEKGIEGLVHISEMSWTKKITNPQEIFAIGDIVEVQILNVDKDNRRISLSVRQLEANPWLDAEKKYIVGSRLSGKVKSFADYGAFVELDDGIEGMVHVNDMSWLKRVNNPQDVLKKGQRVDVVVLQVDGSNRRLSLGLKQLEENPWAGIAEKYAIDSSWDSEVVKVTDFGVFVKLEDGLEGLIFSNEISKEAMSALKPADKIKVKVIKVDIEQEKIGLSANV
ncbi:MAG: 30S ribosomal protein S1 [Candidatus Omnitrophica bacterium]|nr:30S ribosomal protein S1 [Candidatus Omnitrophota bacterium]